MNNKKGVPIIPIILSPCGWLDDKNISKLLALPTDGAPITSFQNKDEGWLDVYNGLKKIIEKELKIKQLEINEEFRNFLQGADLLEEANPQKERIFLNDIFIYPVLDKYDEMKEYEREISAKELFENVVEFPKIVIAGEGQSGKTTLCKVIFNELRKRNFVPVYITGKKDRLEGKIETRVKKAILEQYMDIDIDKIDQKKIVPIIDDFHYAKKKEKHLNDLAIYPRCIITVDDVFSLNIKDEKLIEPFSYFKINELRPSLRYELIKKWVTAGERERQHLGIYKNIDERIELINSILGKTIGKGVLPAYPFFILSAIVTYETFAMPLDQEITSQGYCYQAFIYFYLRKQGVRNDEIDTYINFLTELAFYFYKEKKHELSPDDFTSFMNSYTEKYNLLIKQELLLSRISLLVTRDSFNNYFFRYPYIYYFFVAKYLSENIDKTEVKREIEKIMNNLHVDENAYIAVFIVHHSKNVNILDELKINALCLFDKYEPATLVKKEVKFFDKQVDIIVEAALPPATITPEREREKVIKAQDKIEQFQDNVESQEYEAFVKDLRRAVRTVEVMGCIIKNRAGSLPTKELEEIFSEAMNVHLRILSFFFDLVKNEDGQREIIEFLSKRLEKIILESKSDKKELTQEELKRIATTIFWNLNFFVVHGIFQKVIHSLGSDKLTKIIEKVCNEIDTPATSLLKHGILTWYNKNLRVDEIAKTLDKKDFSEIAKRVAKMMVVQYCSLHPVNYKDRQRIESKLKISVRKFLKGG